MRGKGPVTQLMKKPSGITPAYAGKSKSHRSKEERGKDHPRVCGEKILEKLDEIYHAGSPPRMRGKVTGNMEFDADTRITPAYAGKSWFYVFLTL